MSHHLGAFRRGIRSGLHSTQRDSGTPCSLHQSSFSRPPLPLSSENLGSFQPPWCPHQARAPRATRTTRSAPARASQARMAEGGGGGAGGERGDGGGGGGGGAAASGKEDRREKPGGADSGFGGAGQPDRERGGVERGGFDRGSDHGAGKGWAQGHRWQAGD